ncbi:hypothetical protein [Flavobacterium sp. XGLA_31]|uniref:hypothetical protein n=1 Tax=Flavobacterium sp. XGLA_31 TaxID=3447666 RepID=UPI003F3108DD
MKKIFLLLLLFGLVSCRQQGSNTAALQKEVDSLRANAYKPGFGEFMSSIQVHHNKLWFAGQHKNWKLADFEIHEIMEAVDNIKKYQTERKESQWMPMIEPALDSVNRAIQQQNKVAFDRSYTTLTNTCNHCHETVHFEFNVVKVPDTPPYSNQDFKAK